MFTHTYIYIYIYIYMYVCIYVYMYIYIYICLFDMYVSLSLSLSLLFARVPATRQSSCSLRLAVSGASIRCTEILGARVKADLG